jgi:hypothetical protein
VSERHHLNIFRKCRVFPTHPEYVEGEPGNVAQAWIADIDLPAVGKVQPQWDEWVALELDGKGLGIHALSISGTARNDQIKVGTAGPSKADISRIGAGGHTGADGSRTHDLLHAIDGAPSSNTGNHNELRDTVADGCPERCTSGAGVDVSEGAEPRDDRGAEPANGQRAKPTGEHFAEAVAMLARLPLTDAERAEAVRRLLAGAVAGNAGDR